MVEKPKIYRFNIVIDCNDAGVMAVFYKGNFETVNLLDHTYLKRILKK